MKRATDFKIAGSARKDWDQHVTPHSIEEIVEAIFALPDDEIKEVEHSTAFTPSAWIAHARVLGRLYMINGLKNSAGEWIVVRFVAPAWPPPEKEAVDDA